MTKDSQDNYMDLETILKCVNYKGICPMTGVLLLVTGSCFLWKLLREIAQWYDTQKTSPPGPWGLPVVGYLPFLGREPHKTFWSLKEKYGEIIGVSLGTKYTVVLNEYNVAKEVLCNSAALDRAPEMFDHLRLSGFLSENGEKWLEQRRFCISATRDLGLGKLYWEDLIMEETCNFIRKLQDLKGKPTDISHELENSLVSNIMTLLIGRRLTENSKEANKIKLAIDYSNVALTLTGPSFPNTVMPFLRKFCQFFKIGGHDKISQTLDEFSIFIQEEIVRQKTSPDMCDVQSFINSYLKKILELSESNNVNHAFSESMLEGNFNTLFLAASDTIYSAIGWLFRLMCKHKDIQDKVHAELMEVLGKDGRARYDERHMIPYTFAVLMESLRYANIGPLSATRRSNEDIYINGYKIPKGSDITANLWALHNDPAYWEEPEAFRPERFLTDGGTKLVKQPLSYAPFSLGRRNCPGETIAWIEVLLYLSEVLKKFEISTAPGDEPEFEILNGIVSRLAPQPLCFKEQDA